VISPRLANLFLHDAFDIWMARKFPPAPFGRSADDAICHCRTGAEVRAATGGAADEQGLGDVRCRRRLTPKAANENRSRQARAGRASTGAADKQKASLTPAPRP
jgi:hypothetical protein